VLLLPQSLVHCQITSGKFGKRQAVLPVALHPSPPGCILADDMGLGKTLQGLTLLWTLVTSLAHPLLMGTDTQPAAATGGPPAASDTRRPGSCAPGGLPPIARRVIIVCPTSLVSNWDSGAWEQQGTQQSVSELAFALKGCLFSLNLPVH
jgi:hypothetical protein